MKSIQAMFLVGAVMATHAIAQAGVHFACTAAETNPINEIIKFSVDGSGDKAQVLGYDDNSTLQEVTSPLLTYVMDISPGAAFQGTLTFVNKDGSAGASGTAVVIFSSEVLSGQDGTLLSMRGEDPITYSCLVSPAKN